MKLCDLFFFFFYKNEDARPRAQETLHLDEAYTCKNIPVTTGRIYECSILIACNQLSRKKRRRRRIKEKELINETQRLNRFLFEPWIPPTVDSFLPWQITAPRSSRHCFFTVLITQD